MSGSRRARSGWTRLVTAAVTVAVVVSAVEAVTFVAAKHSARASADASTGTAGLFVATTGRVLDTRNGTGGYTTPMPNATWRSVQVAGNAGVPGSGVSAVALNFTVLSPAAGGNLHADMGGHTSTATSYLNWNAGDTVSNSGVIALSTAGAINVLVTTASAVNMLMDVQGYYTAGNGAAAAGGYVPVTATTIVDTGSGLNTPQATIATGGTRTVPIAGLGGIPADASAAMLNYTLANTNTVAGFITPYPAGGTRPTVSLNFPASANTAVSGSVDLGTDGKISIYVGAGGPVNLSVQVEGYFTATGSAAGTSGQFTPAATRAYDSRVSPNVALASGATRTIQVAGRTGVPVAGSGISALALEVAVIAGTGATGHLQAWPDDGTAATALDQYYTGTIRSNFVIIRPGADGGINIQNSSSGSINVIIDVEGWYTTLGAAIPNGQTRTQERLTLQGTATGAGDWVTYQYRTGTTGSFSAVPVANVTVPGTTTHPSAWPVQRNSSSTFDPYTWDVKDTLASSTDTLVQLEACFGSSATDANPVCSMPSNVEYSRSAFGDSYATDELGPGVLALLTGDFQVNASDVDVASYLGSFCRLAAL